MLAQLLHVVLAQAGDVVHQAPPSPWMSPGFLLSVGAAVVAIVGWLIRQDRRISKSEDLEVKVFGDKTTPGALKTLEVQLLGQLERYQTREHCGQREREVDGLIREAPSKGSVADAFEQIRELKDAFAEDRKANAVALARIEATLQALVDQVAALAGDERKPIRPIGRTRTGEFDPRKGG